MTPLAKYIEFVPSVSRTGRGDAALRFDVPADQYTIQGGQEVGVKGMMCRVTLLSLCTGALAIGAASNASLPGVADMLARDEAIQAAQRSVLVPERYVTGEVLMLPVAGRAEAAAGLLNHFQLNVLEQDAFSGVMRVAVPAEQEVAFAAMLSVDPNIMYAELNGIGEGGVVPDDTFFNVQWHLRNIGQTGGTPGADVAATRAWDVLTGSPTIGVAVLDSGIQSNHPEFAGRIASNGWDFVNGNSSPEDDHAHGTWVTGAMAANGNNTFGVAGMDWGVTIIPVKVLDQNNSGTTFNLAQGLNYSAAQSNVDIISMSLIGYPGNMTLNNALGNARTEGKILIACAGNGGIGNADVSFPGASPLTISIGATTHTDARASFSGTGNALDFVAPGAAIRTTAFGTVNDTFTTVSGCSLATPIAAGIASLVLARAEQFGITLTHDDLYDVFLLAAVDEVGPPGEDAPGWDPFFGHGRLSARLAVQAVVSCDAADLTCDGVVDTADLLILLGAWGPCPIDGECPADLNGDGVVDVIDLLLLLAAWG